MACRNLMKVWLKSQNELKSDVEPTGKGRTTSFQWGKQTLTFGNLDFCLFVLALIPSLEIYFYCKASIKIVSKNLMCIYHMIRSGFHTLVNMKEMALTCTQCVSCLFFTQLQSLQYMCFPFPHHYVTHFLMFLHGPHDH